MPDRVAQSVAIGFVMDRSSGFLGSNQGPVSSFVEGFFTPNNTSNFKHTGENIYTLPRQLANHRQIVEKHNT